MHVRRARPDEVPTVATVLDAAMLESGDLRPRVDASDVYVAVDGGTVLGAAVVVPPARAPAWARERGTDAHLSAVAVRRRRRGQGIGSALVAAVAERGRVTAAFDAAVRAFYESLGFAVERDGDGQLRGVADACRGGRA